MIFKENRQIKRDKNTTENFAQAQKIALNLLKKEDSTKMINKNKKVKNSMK